MADEPKYRVNDLVELPGSGPAGPWRVNAITVSVGVQIYLLRHATNPSGSRVWPVSEEHRLVAVEAELEP